MIFFSGCGDPSLLPEYEANGIPALFSVNRLFKRLKSGRYSVRQSPLKFNGDWMLDSGAFTRISRLYGFKSHLPVKKYAALIQKFTRTGNCLAVVSQDYMCEPFILGVTGLTIPNHQRLTIHRYDRLLEELNGNSPHVLPVLQGFDPQDYVSHIRQYGHRLHPGMWVGVGSVCKRNSSPDSIRQVLTAIKKERPDLRLHGFGLKLTSLQLGGIRDLLYSADSAAADLWSQPGNRKTRKYQNARNVAHLIKYRERLDMVQLELDFMKEIV